MKLSTRRALAAIVASSCLALPASASAVTGVAPQTQSAAALAQERYYSSYDDSETLDGGRSAALAQERYYSSYDDSETLDGGPSAAQAQERYYSSYGDPEPLTVAETQAPSDDTPWLPLALSAAGALAIVAASAHRVRRLHIRRAARVAT